MVRTIRVTKSTGVDVEKYVPQKLGKSPILAIVSLVYHFIH